MNPASLSAQDAEALLGALDAAILAVSTLLSTLPETETVRSLREMSGQVIRALDGPDRHDANKIHKLVLDLYVSIESGPLSKDLARTKRGRS